MITPTLFLCLSVLLLGGGCCNKCVAESINSFTELILWVVSKQFTYNSHVLVHSSFVFSAPHWVAFNKFLSPSFLKVNPTFVGDWAQGRIQPGDRGPSHPAGGPRAKPRPKKKKIKIFLSMFYFSIMNSIHYTILCGILTDKNRPQFLGKT